MGDGYSKRQRTSAQMNMAAPETAETSLSLCSSHFRSLSLMSFSLQKINATSHLYVNRNGWSELCLQSIDFINHTWMAANKRMSRAVESPVYFEKTQEVKTGLHFNTSNSQYLSYKTECCGELSL